MNAEIDALRPRTGNEHHEMKYMGKLNKYSWLSRSGIRKSFVSRLVLISLQAFALLAGMLCPNAHAVAEESCDGIPICGEGTETHGNEVDEDGDGITLTIVLEDATDDSDYSSLNELSRFSIGWDENALALGFDYTLESNAIIWYFDLGFEGGETDFLSTRGYAGAYPSEVILDRDIEFMVATYGDLPLYEFRVTDNTSTDITYAAEASCRTVCREDGSPGYAYAKIPWSEVYADYGGVIPIGASLDVVGVIRAGNDGLPADIAPDNGPGTIVNYVTLPLDRDGDGLLDLDFFSDQDGDSSSVFQGDCDDSEPTVYPQAVEICDGVDSNCDGIWDDEFDADGLGGVDCLDDDGDGVSEEEGDCDDGNALISPLQEELPENGTDDDCDGEVDESSTPTPEPSPSETEAPSLTPLSDTPTPEPSLFETEVPTETPLADSPTPEETFTPVAESPESSPVESSITPSPTASSPPPSPSPVDLSPTLAVSPTDSSSTPSVSPVDLSPSATASPIDFSPSPSPSLTEASPAPTSPEDSSLSPSSTPESPTPDQNDSDGDGYSELNGDCDDNDPDIFPAAIDICDDGVDNNCNGYVDEGLPETCDERDNDCNGLVDDGVVLLNSGECVTSPGFGCGCTVRGGPAPWGTARSVLFLLFVVGFFSRRRRP